MCLPLSEPPLFLPANEDDDTLRNSGKERGYPRTGELGTSGKPTARSPGSLLSDKRAVLLFSSLKPHVSTYQQLGGVFDHLAAGS